VRTIWRVWFRTWVRASALIFVFHGFLLTFGFWQWCHAKVVSNPAYSAFGTDAMPRLFVIIDPAYCRLLALMPMPRLFVVIDPAYCQLFGTDAMPRLYCVLW
jgi:hypothetical protein